MQGPGGRDGEGNGTPLQCSCLENPTDGGAWWATVHGVAKPRTRLSDLAAAAGGRDGRRSQETCRRGVQRIWASPRWGRGSSGEGRGGQGGRVEGGERCEGVGLGGQQRRGGREGGKRVGASVGISEGMFSRGQTGLIHSTCGSWWSGGLRESEG